MRTLETDRVIIPLKFRKDFLSQIHSTHMGSSKIEVIAREYFWWPNLDKEIENYSRNCDVCKKSADNSNKAELIEYKQCKEVLERAYMDF